MASEILRSATNKGYSVTGADTVIRQSEKTCVTLVDIFRKTLKTKIY